MQALTCPARSHVTVLINTHYTGLTFCSHKLLEISSTGNAACNHYSGLIIVYGSPQNPQDKYATKDRCMSTTKTFLFTMQREILHKRMGNNDINVDMELQKPSATQLIFCI